MQGFPSKTAVKVELVNDDDEDEPPARQVPPEQSSPEAHVRLGRHVCPSVPASGSATRRNAPLRAASPASGSGRGGVPMPAFYCSPDCQAEHWARHRLDCPGLQHRKGGGGGSGG